MMAELEEKNSYERYCVSRAGARCLDEASEDARRN